MRLNQKHMEIMKGMVYKIVERRREVSRVKRDKYKDDVS